MGETTTEIEAPITRRSRADRPAREVHREAPSSSVTIEGTAPEVVTPDAALADSQRQLQQRDRELAEARRREQQARSEAAQARVQDHSAVVGAAVEAAKAAKQAAISAKRAAREAGDIDAELAADDELSGASFRLISAEAELARLKTEPPQQPTQQAGAPSEAAQRWLETHPRFYDDETYRAFAEGLHSAALRALGDRSNGSQQYIDWIEQRMARQFGADHAQTGSEGRPVATNGGYQPASRRDDGGAVAPSRHAGGSGGWKTIRTDLGAVQYQDRPDGTRGIRFADRTSEENYREGARLNTRLWERDPNAALGEYVNEHIEHVLEGSPDIRIGDGRRWGDDDR